MNCTRKECDKNEKHALSMMESQNILQQIASITSELSHQKKLAKDEACELQSLREKNKQIAKQLDPVQTNYKLTRNSLKQMQECVNQRKLKVQNYDKKICELKNVITEMDEESNKFKNDQHRISKSGGGKLQKIIKRHDELKRKLLQLKTEHCTSAVIPGNQDDVDGRLLVATKEYEVLTQLTQELEAVISKAEKHVHGIASCNSSIYKEIQKLEDCVIPEINGAVVKYQQTIEQQQQQLKSHEEKRAEQLSMNEHMSQKITQDCVKKQKLTLDLKQSLENCRTLKEDHQKKLELEDKLAAKTDCLKQQNKQLMHKLATLKKRLEKRSACVEYSSSVTC